LVLILSLYLKFSGAGAHINGEARKIGAQASISSQNAGKNANARLRLLI
jgi:hypothetical protein